MRAPSRRRVVQVAGLSLAGLGRRSAARAQPATAAPAAVPAAAGPPAPLNRFPRMVHEHFVAAVRAAEEANRRALAELRTRADAEGYVAEVRRKIRAAFGPPPPRTPLEARTTGRLERDAYVIEKVVFASRPGMLVTATLDLPRGAGGRRPAVLGCCGHSDAGKAFEGYQSFAQALARLGYVSLIFDPIGQGERLQYLDAALRPRVGVGVPEHLLAGNQQMLVGEFFGAWRAWDGVRALDYLLARPEVDARQVGVTGNSGGGTLATWLLALDDRFTMGAPSCFVTTFRRNLENELPADTEQCPPGVLAAGLDHADFIAAAAPRPVLLINKEGDYFDARGTEEAFGRLRRLYELLGAGDRIALHTTPGYHGYSKEGREGMYRWFNRFTEVSRATEEPALTIEKPEALLAAAPRGQVAALGSRTVFSFTRQAAEALARRRKKAGGAGLVRDVREALRLPAVGAGAPTVPDYRILRPLRGRGYPKPHAAVYAVESEPGVQAIVYRLSSEALLSRPPRGPRRAVLYVAHHSSDAELRGEPLVADLIRAEPAAAFYACDVRGIGESRPDTCGANTFLDPYGSDYFYAAHAIMLDRPYVGQKTRDLLAVIAWLGAAGHAEIHLAGRGWGALPAAFAALLAPPVVQVTLKNALESYGAVARAETYRWPLSTFVPGVLRHFDLDDVYRALAAKRLRQIDPWAAEPPRG